MRKHFFFFFCTPIPFDAVPTIAAGLASTSIRRHWHGPEALFYLPGIQHTEPLCWRRNVRLCRATSAGLTVMKPACTASAELEMSQLRMVFLLQRHATASLSRCTGVKYYYSFMARRWSRIALITHTTSRILTLPCIFPPDSILVNLHEW